MADDLHPDLKNRPVAWRRLLLPNEHGSWAFLLEPLLLGVLVACSPAALWLALAVVLGFIARKPAKLAFAPAIPSTRALQKPARLVLAAVSLSAAFSVVCAVLASRWQILIPLAGCLPALVVLAVREQKGQNRTLVTELIATGLCSIPLFTIAIAANWPISAAFALGCVNLARAWPSLLYVRACLRRTRGETGQLMPALLAQMITPLLLTLLAHQHLIPTLVVSINIALSARAAFFLFTKRPPFTAKQLGIMEVVWGLLYIGLTALAYRR